MRTIKRTPETVSTNIKVEKYNKYFNQMEFTGIKQDDNIYAIDQKSCRDAKNVYVDDNQRLVSRPSLQAAEMPDSPVNHTQGTTTDVTKTTDSSVIPITYRLIDIKDFDCCRLYISQSVQYGTFTIYAVLNDESDYEGLANGKTANFVLPLSGMGNITAYHISAVDHYIICFNNQDAKVLDTTALYMGWQKLTNFAEIPVVKRVSTSTTEYDTYNQFIPNIYKEEYLWSNESQPVLPANSSADVKVTGTLGEYNFSDVANLDQFPEYRLIRPINVKDIALDSNGRIENEPIISCAKDNICIAYSTYLLFSANKGRTFERIYYPNYTAPFLNIAEISHDGSFFFFVARSGVYRLNLSTKLWSSVFKGPSLSGNIVGDAATYYAGRSNLFSYFMTGDTFTFMLTDNNTGDDIVYFKGNQLYMGNDYTDDHMDPDQTSYYVLGAISNCNNTNSTAFSYYNLVATDASNLCKAKSIKMSIDTINGKDVASIVIAINNSNVPYLLCIVGGDTQAYTGKTDMFARVATTQWLTGPLEGYWATRSTIYNLVYSANELSLITLSNYNFNSAYSSFSNRAAILRITIDLAQALTENILSSTRTNLGNFGDSSAANNSLPIALDTNMSIFINTLFNTTNQNDIRIDSRTDYFDDNYVLDIKSSLVCSADNMFIAVSRDASMEYKLWTNLLDDATLFTIDYLIGDIAENKLYKEVPRVSYADTELYLAFDNLLQITYNGDYNSATPFYLPKINNQSFVENITGLINISTKEVAVFFENDIKICAKTIDENLTQGFRYDYYNTKLSTGIRLGDSVINTLEGDYTVFPTLRGLAVMNYQAFMATSDQVLTYLSDDIKEIWSDFFGRSLASGKMIRIIQWRDRLFITNNTTECLIYDFTRQAWWKWELHQKSLVALSNQFYLYIITNIGTTLDTLFVFKPEAKNYYDDSERGDFSHPVEWFYMSQPLHFNSPNYYKNIKQLVFQLSDSDGTDGKVSKTMDTQIRLFRKKLTTREPETISFKIQELRTFVKRFNYWKINELQWGISNDSTTSTPFRLELNGISVKYDLGEEVR